MVGDKQQELSTTPRKGTKAEGQATSEREQPVGCVLVAVKMARVVAAVVVVAAAVAVVLLAALERHSGGWR